MASSGGQQNIFILWSFIVILFGDFVASQEHNCSQVKCPPTSSYHCPEDSYALETNEFTAITTDEEHQIVEEVLVHCCVTKMCACRICDIPSCHNSSLVLIETEKGSDIPGKCCSKYKCDYEPDCDEVINTYGHWLVDCQRCECLAGQRICHRSCDEIGPPPSSCLSQNLKKMFSNGDTWKEDECTHCQCHFGTLKCQTSLCRPLHCGKKMKLPGECCPICVEESSTAGDEENIVVITHPHDIQSTTENIDAKNSQKPCGVPEFLPTRQNCILYGIIVALSIILVVFIGLYYHEKSKQRSYKPVSVLDDNFNKITGKIKSKEFTYA